MKGTMRVRALLTGLVPILAGVLVLGVVIVWAAGGFRTMIQPGQTPASGGEGLAASEKPLGTAEVEEVVKPYTEDAIGTLKAASRTEVSSRVLAPINEIRVQAGSRVRQGDILVELDKEALKSQLSQAEAGLAGAKAALAQAEADYKTAQNLRKRNPDAISDQEFGRAASAAEVAKANLDRATRAVDEVQVMLTYATIRAPSDGMVIEKQAQKGDMARPGVPLLAMHDPASLRLEVPVREELASKIKLGDRRDVRIDALNLALPATVDEIVPQADLASRSILVKLKLAPHKDLVDGMTGRLVIPTGVRRHVCLPRAAVRRIGDLDFVQVLRPDGSTERRFIRTGREGRQDHLEVLSGLEPGETVALWSAPAAQAAPGKEAAPSHE